MKVQEVQEQAEEAVEDFMAVALDAIRKLQAQVKTQQHALDDAYDTIEGLSRELDEANNTIETLRQQSPWRDYGRPQR